MIDTKTTHTYPKYKTTEQAWLGEIPEHWEVLKGNYLFDAIDKRSKTGKETLLTVSEHKGVRLRSDSNVNMFMAENYTGYKLCEPGDLVINSLWAWSRGLGFSNYSGIVSTAYSVFRPRTNLVSEKYLNYLLRTQRFVDQYRIYSKGIWISRLQLSDWAFQRIPMLCPPLPEQQAIAAFLDEKTAKIETAIAQKEKLIELLKERKQIVIQELVTGKKVWDEEKKAWAKPAETVDSKIEWIGEIPTGWEVKKLFGICRFVRGNSTFSKDELLTYGEYVALQYGKSYKVNEVDEKYEFYVNKEFYKDSQVVNNGDTVFISTSETIEDLGHSVFYKRNDLGLLGGEQVLLKPNIEAINSKYLYYSSKVFSKELKKYATGIKVFRFNINNLKKIYISVPSKAEQNIIVQQIESQSTKIDRAIAMQEQQIEKLKEYKKVLIDEVVRGKRRVC